MRTGTSCYRGTSSGPQQRCVLLIAPEKGADDRDRKQLGINRVAQASSVNVIPLVWTDRKDFEYFPLDEDHPCRPDEPYGLSKM